MAESQAWLSASCGKHTEATFSLPDLQNCARNSGCFQSPMCLLEVMPDAFIQSYLLSTCCVPGHAVKDLSSDLV